MKSHAFPPWGVYSLVCLLGLVLLVAAKAESSAPAREPVKLIFDTDMGNDVDDAMALAVIHALQSRGECDLLAVTITRPDPLAGRFVDAVNTFYGRGDIPIAVRRQGGRAEPDKFLKLATVREGERLRYANDFNPDTAPEPVTLLRQTLARQPDAGVVLVQVGFSGNLTALLDSSPDAISPLAGGDLVRQKVRLLSIMAGAFQTIHHNNRYLEYNVAQEIPAAQKLAAQWPTPVVWSGFEIGITVPYPAVSIERDFGYVAHHIVAEAYRLYMPPPHERPTWDLTSVLYAVRPDRDYFALSPPGRVTVEDDGFTRFRPQSDGRDRYLILDNVRAARVREALVQLISQPPAARAGN